MHGGPGGADVGARRAGVRPRRSRGGVWNAPTPFAGMSSESVLRGSAPQGAAGRRGLPRAEREGAGQVARLVPRGQGFGPVPGDLAAQHCVRGGSHLRAHRAQGPRAGRRVVGSADSPLPPHSSHSPHPQDRSVRPPFRPPCPRTHSKPHLRLVLCPAGQAVAPPSAPARHTLTSRKSPFWCSVSSALVWVSGLRKPAEPSWVVVWSLSCP